MRRAASAGVTNTLLQKTQKGATQIVSPLLEIGFVLGSFWVRFFWLVLAQFVVSPLCVRVNDFKRILKLGSFCIKKVFSVGQGPPPTGLT